MLAIKEFYDVKMVLIRVPHETSDNDKMSSCDDKTSLGIAHTRLLKIDFYQFFIVTIGHGIPWNSSCSGEKLPVCLHNLTSLLAFRTPQKSLWKAYLCWLVGGIFGLHHLYLGRDRQAFIWWSTVGGYFLVGWSHDLFRMPELVRDANEDPKFIEKFKENIRKNQRPPFSTNKFLGQIMISYLWCQVFLMAIPENEFHGINFNFLHWLVPLIASLGVWSVGNLGREQGTIWKCLFASYLVYPIRYIIYDEAYWLTAIIVISAIVFDNYSKQWRLSPPKKRSKRRRFLTLSVACCLYLGLLGCYFYFNAKITDSEGDEVPVHEAISNFFTSPWWTDLKNSLNETWKYAKHHGFYETWKQIIDMLDADGEQNAYKTLGLLPTASQSEITAAFRKLSKENHPDKVKVEEEKKIAQEKFMEISHAYEVLSKIKSKRKKKNNRYTAPGTDERDL